MTAVADVALDDELTVSIEPGGDDWEYVVTVVYDGDSITEYGSNFEPWGRAGRHVLGNILVARIDAYEDRERVGTVLEETFATRASELEAALRGE